MDTQDVFLSTLALDTEGINAQFMSLGALFNIVLAAIMGLLVLLVYLASSSRQTRDHNLFTVLPVLSILMAVIMRIQGPQIVLFFGIFGIMSIIRFRSDLTDQKGITFILFAVIVGVLIGVNSYLLAFLAWLVVASIILVFRRVLHARCVYRLELRAAADPEETRTKIETWCRDRRIDCRFTGFSGEVEFSGKTQTWDTRYKSVFLVFPRREEDFTSSLPELNRKVQEWGHELAMKRQD